MTQKQLEDYLWGAANILRGMIDAADFNNTFSFTVFQTHLRCLGQKNIRLLWMNPKVT